MLFCFYTHRSAGCINIERRARGPDGPICHYTTELRAVTHSTGDCGQSGSYLREIQLARCKQTRLKSYKWSDIRSLLSRFTRLCKVRLSCDIIRFSDRWYALLLDEIIRSLSLGHPPVFSFELRHREVPAFHTTLTMLRDLAPTNLFEDVKPLA